MSEDNSIIDNSPEDKKVENKSEVNSALEGYKADMFKHKKASKDKDALIEELTTRLSSIEDDQLMQQDKWKELYNKEKDEKQLLLNDISEKEQRIQNSQKRTALRQELGSVKDAYLVHADIASIQLNEDGLADQETVLAVANKFRENHSELLSKQVDTNATGIASPSDSTVSSNEPSIKDLSTKQLQEMLNKLT